MKRGIATERGDKYLRIIEANQQIEAYERQVIEIEHQIKIEIEESSSAGQPRTNTQREKTVITQDNRSTSNTTVSHQPSDAQLLQLLQTLQQWKQSQPQKPNQKRGEELKQRYEKLYRQYQQTEAQLSQKGQQLKELGQARFLFNPFGVSPEILEATEKEINSLQITLSQISVQLNHAAANFKSWQLEARNYIAWFNDSQPKKMQKLEEYLSSSPISERVQQLKKSQKRSQQRNTNRGIEL